MKDDTFDYESHQEWAERVQPRPDYGPKRTSPVVPIFGGILAALAIVVACCGLLLMTGVLTWR